jgi:GT2 family glycosyltransferase
MKQFGVIILNFNGLMWLDGLISALKEDEYKHRMIIFADNASTDESVQYIRENLPAAHVLRFERNYGYCGANNFAAQYAFELGCDVVVFQNSDTLVTPNWLTEMDRALCSDPTIGAAGPSFLDWDSDNPSPFMEKRYGDIAPLTGSSDHGPIDVDWIEGSSLFVTKEAAKSVGLFDPTFFMYWEDADLCRRIRISGMRVTIVTGAVVRHFGGGSTEVSKFNVRKEGNEFGYTLSDPANSWVVNVIRFSRLFLTKLKQSLQSGKPKCVISYLTIFWSFRQSWKTWRRKWVNERQGNFRPVVSDSFEVQIILPFERKEVVNATSE